MDKNVGGIDRTARLILGPVLVVVALAALLGLVAVDLWLTLVVLLVGAILTVTGLVQTCPANRLFGLDTYDSTAADRDDLGAEETRR